jgi:hypothetical protein
MKVGMNVMPLEAILHTLYNTDAEAYESMKLDQYYPHYVGQWNIVWLSVFEKY